MRKEDFRKLGLTTRAERQAYLRHKREMARALHPIRARIRMILLGLA